MKNINTFTEFVNEGYLNERRSNFDKKEESIIKDIKDALSKLNLDLGSGPAPVEVSVDSNNKNLPDGEYAIMPFTKAGDYWKAKDLKIFADEVVGDLDKALKRKIELVKVDTGRSIRSWIIKVK